MALSLREQEQLDAQIAQGWKVKVPERTGRWGSFTIDFPTEQKMIGDAVVCPEQLDGLKGSPEGRL